MNHLRYLVVAATSILLLSKFLTCPTLRLIVSSPSPLIVRFAGTFCLSIILFLLLVLNAWSCATIIIPSVSFFSLHFLATPPSFIMNDFPVIGDPCFAHRIIGSPRGKHCESLRRNVWRSVASPLKRSVFGHRMPHFTVLLWEVEVTNVGGLKFQVSVW